MNISRQQLDKLIHKPWACSLLPTVCMDMCLSPGWALWRWFRISGPVHILHVYRNAVLTMKLSSCLQVIFGYPWQSKSATRLLPWNFCNRYLRGRTLINTQGTCYRSATFSGFSSTYDPCPVHSLYVENLGMVLLSCSTPDQEIHTLHFKFLPSTLTWLSFWPCCTGVCVCL